MIGEYASFSTSVCALVDGRNRRGCCVTSSGVSEVASGCRLYMSGGSGSAGVGFGARAGAGEGQGLASYLYWTGLTSRICYEVEFITVP